MQAHDAPMRNIAGLAVATPLPLPPPPQSTPLALDLRNDIGQATSDPKGPRPKVIGISFGKEAGAHDLAEDSSEVVCHLLPGTR
jgi:hypothetical protein